MDVLEKERLIKNTLNSKPDSARIYIKQLLNYKGKLHDTVYAGTYLYYGTYYNLKSKPDSALYYFEKAEGFIDLAKKPMLYARMLRNKAVAFKKKADHAEALKLLNEAEKIYETANDLKGVGLTYGEMASNYNLMVKSDKAISYLLKAIALLEQSNETFDIITVKFSLANTYLNSGNLVFAADLYKDVIKQFKEKGHLKGYSTALLNYGDCMIRLHKYIDAYNAISKAIPILKNFKDGEILAISYSKLGKIKMEEGDFSASEVYYEDALSKALELKSFKTISIASEYIFMLNRQKKYEESLQIIALVDKDEFFQKTNLTERMHFETQKTITYKVSNKKDKALASAKNLLAINATLKRSSNDTITQQLQQQYQNTYQSKKGKSLENKNANLTGELEKRHMIKLIPVIGITVTFILTFMAFVLICWKNKQKLEKAKTGKDMLIKEYENTRNINKENIKNLEYKSRELVTGMISLATLEGNINKLVAQCGESPDKMCINEIKAQLQSLTSDDDYWKLFRKRFNEAYSNFQTDLKKQFPVLTKNDLYFCALLKLNLPYKDMAMLMQVSPESIVKKKYRVKKKMKIDTEQELESILLNTSK